MLLLFSLTYTYTNSCHLKKMFGVLHCHSISTHQIAQKNVKFEWNDKCQASFEKLKQLLIEAPLLTQPTPSKEYTLYSDASRIGLGCVLMQDGKVVAYLSR